MGVTALKAGVLTFCACLSLMSLNAYAQSPAAAPKVACLWSGLPPHTQLRLELGIKNSGALPADAVQQLGSDALVSLLTACGFTAQPQTIELMLQYWLVRASVDVRRFEARNLGVSMGLAQAALQAKAPPSERRALAQDMLSRRSGQAEKALREAVEQVDAITPLEPKAKVALGRYFAAKIISEGMERGATP